jgi:Domain of unknown function (DUF1918)
MEAHVGDRIVVEGAKVGHPRREGEVLEVVTALSSTYYRVRWSDGQETVFFPSSDARVETRRSS